eukprot:1811258-Prymnesium_polylepis.1
MQTYARMSTRRPDCPLCKVSLPDSVLTRFGCDEEVLQRCEQADSDSGGARVDEARESAWQARQFLAAARQLHMRRCPSCKAPIVKNGGCDNMMCGACRYRFSWRKAPIISRCRCLRFEQGEAALQLYVGTAHVGQLKWLRTCYNCHPATRAVQVAWNTGVAAAVVPGAAIRVLNEIGLRCIARPAQRKYANVMAPKLDRLRRGA